MLSGKLFKNEDDLEYAEHYENDFYIINEGDATNFKIVKTPVEKPSKENWVDVIPHKKKLY
jgi:oligopeptidase B